MDCGTGEIFLKSFASSRIFLMGGQGGAGAAKGRETALHRESDWARLLAEQITKNGRLFFSLAHGLVRNSKTAEEVCQHALLKAHEHRVRLLDADAEVLKAWLQKVVINECRRIRRHDRVERQGAAAGYFPARKPVEPPHHHVDLPDAVAVALEKLPDEVCAVVVLRHMEGLKGKEVAQMLGISAVDVCRLLAQGVERLREHLADWNPRAGDKP